MIHPPLFCFDGADCTAYRSVGEAEGDLEPPAAADGTVLFGANGARLRLELGEGVIAPRRRRWWRPEWRGPAAVRVEESGELAPEELAERLRTYLGRDAAQLDLSALVERAAARAAHS